MRSLSTSLWEEGRDTPPNWMRDLSLFRDNLTPSFMPQSLVSCEPKMEAQGSRTVCNNRGTLMKRASRGQHEVNLGITDTDTACSWELAVWPS